MKKGDSLDIESLYDRYSFTPKEGEIIKGRIIKRLDDTVLVDLGLKSEGLLPVTEFKEGEIEPGKEIWVYLESIESQEGTPLISKRKADFQLAWEKIKRIYETGEPVEVKVLKKIKGGFLVDLLGVDAFLPGSQLDIKPHPATDELIGKTFEARIIKLNWMRKNIVVSRRIILEEQSRKIREKVFSRLKVGDVIEVTVKNITDFGAFVDVGGIDALLHITDISWGKISHPSEKLKVNDKIKVKVLTLDPEAERIAVGMKQLVPHPWEGIEERYPIGSKVRGKVTSILDYGIFVQLEKDIEGLVHISEMSWNKNIKHPSQLVEVGDYVEAIVLNIDRENRRISLGMKQTKPDPWAVIDDRFKVGDVVKVKVKTLKDYGAFVELDEGIEGLIHISDFSWTKKPRHPREVVKKGQRIEAKILKIDKENRKLALSLKHLQEDPFAKLCEKLKEGDKLRCRIVDLPAKGVRVELGEVMEEFIPISQLVRRKGKKTKDNYSIGEEINVVVRKIDPENRRILLSERAFYEIPKKEKPKPAPKKPDKITFEDIARRS
ncbi:30S ribosomal protein S1 [candidate division WOR-3 bacterium]|uniref:Small ribosomal subunit protein bS1 n=1 Tax=candidate division WOR-3 bacterium TaxID=2052148 RepID=A0A660SIC1_UNCW3|nr:MAG: 30S ribosomal protein S1 [candidate division WOR-3 bacterium]